MGLRSDLSRCLALFLKRLRLCRPHPFVVGHCCTASRNSVVTKRKTSEARPFVAVVVQDTSRIK
jgi:hypothetical protein